MRIAIGALAAVLALAIAGAAWAGPAQCLWEHLPAAKRSVVLDAFDRSVAEGLGADAFSDEDFGAAHDACGDPTMSKGDARLGQALAGYQLEYAAGRWLIRREGVDQAKLDAAWATVEREMKRATALTDTAARKAALRPLGEKFAVALGLPVADRQAQSPAMQYAFAYILGRAKRETHEAGLA